MDYIKNHKRTIIIFVLVVAMAVVFKVFGFGSFRSGLRLGFAGNDTRNSYVGTYTKISGTFSKTLYPSKGSTTVQCDFTTKSGSLNVTVVEQKSGRILFDEEITGNKTLGLEADGKVKITLKTSAHSGSYSFKY